VISFAAKLLQPLLHALEPETAHGVSIMALRMMPPISLGVADPRLRVRLQAARDHVGDRWGAVLSARARRLARQLARP
jgi:hypothetical protein